MFNNGDIFREAKMNDIMTPKAIDRLDGQTCRNGHVRTVENTYITPNGERIRCRECDYIANKASRNRRRDARNEYFKVRNKELRKNPEYRAYMSRKLAEHNKRNPIKRKARQALQNAVRAGKIVRPSYCFDCKSIGKPEAHHDDYGKPFKVVWLCKQCHENAHHKGAVYA